MNLNKDIFYLEDTPLLKELESIMAKKGIKEDGYIITALTTEINYPAGTTVIKSIHEVSNNDYYRQKAGKLSIVKTWRKDSLEMAIPEMRIRFLRDQVHSLSVKVHDGWIQPEPEISRRIYSMLDRARYRSAEDRNWQESLRNLAALIILVEKDVKK